MNVDHRALLNGIRWILVEVPATALPTQHAIFEVLVNIESAVEVAAACRRLKKRGYILGDCRTIHDPAANPAVWPISQLFFDQ